MTFFTVGGGGEGGLPKKKGAWREFANLMGELCKKEGVDVIERGGRLIPQYTQC